MLNENYAYSSTAAAAARGHAAASADMLLLYSLYIYSRESFPLIY